jgi:pantothenate kinase
MVARAASQKALRERQIERQTDLRLNVSQQEWWQKSVDAAARNAVAQRQRQTLMDESVWPPLEIYPYR